MPCKETNNQQNEILSEDQDKGRELPVEVVKKINNMLDELVVEYDLPKGALFLSTNVGDQNQISSYSLCIWEPDYPRMGNELQEKNKNILNIVRKVFKKKPETLEMSLEITQEEKTREYLPKEAEVLARNKADQEADMVRIRCMPNVPGFIEYLKENVRYCISNYESKSALFACCSLFEQCSDARKCIHENLLFSKACMYRENLEHGRIFYGKNKNVNLDEN